MHRRVTLIALLAAGFIASCAAAPRPAAAPVAPSTASAGASAKTATLQKPAFVEFYSTI